MLDSDFLIEDLDILVSSFMKCFIASHINNIIQLTFEINRIFDLFSRK